MARVITLLTNAFAVWVVGGTLWALVMPEAFRWFSQAIEITLGIVMLGMGLTLKLSDFASIARMPRAVAIGVVAQFSIMPMLGFLTAKVFHLPPPMAVGVILVGCCPGGTASNVIAFLSRANVPLSVTMTFVSTLFSVVLTPLLTWWLAGTYMQVDAIALLKSMGIVVLLPVFTGAVMNQFLPAFTARVQTVAPLVSVIGVTMIVACIVALGRDLILEHWRVLFLAILAFDSAGFALGYLAARLLKQPPGYCRTVAIEVGMQNSGLGAALAKKHFSAEPLVQVPCAIAAVYHCLLGSLLASFWRARPLDKSGND